MRGARLDQSQLTCARAQRDKKNESDDQLERREPCRAHLLIVRGISWSGDEWVGIDQGSFGFGALKNNPCCRVGGVRYERLVVGVLVSVYCVAAEKKPRANPPMTRRAMAAARVL